MEKQHIYTKNDDAEFEKEVFLQIELDHKKVDFMLEFIKFKKSYFSLKKLLHFLWPK